MASIECCAPHAACCMTNCRGWPSTWWCTNNAAPSAAPLSPEAGSFLWAAAQARTSILVSGPPGAGKTSLLSALIAAVPTNHCIRCCEEIRELSAVVTHGSFYEARQPSLDGGGEVSMRDLVKFVLSMRPDLIVVGEVRGRRRSSSREPSTPGAASSARSTPTRPATRWQLSSTQPSWPART